MGKSICLDDDPETREAYANYGAYEMSLNIDVVVDDASLHDILACRMIQSLI